MAERKEFEAFWLDYRAKVCGTTLFGDHAAYSLARDEPDGDGYLVRNTQDAWSAWQAARAAPAQDDALLMDVARMTAAKCAFADGAGMSMPDDGHHKDTVQLAKDKAARAAPARPAERVRVFRWPINGGGMSDWAVVTNPNEKQSAHCEYAWATIERIEP